MKLPRSKILLFFLPLNIWVTSYREHNNNKPYITTHHAPIYTSRVLSECDIQSSTYNNDTYMKSVKENFDRQTSQRFQEYEERMKDKRQKRKEERDKNTKNIIEKDKMDKSLAEKVEKGCLRCGCGLGGVAASVGLFGGLGTYGWKSAAIAAAKEEAIAEGLTAGAEEVVKAVIKGIETQFSINSISTGTLKTFIDVTNYTKVSVISEKIYSHYSTTCLPRVSGSRLVAGADPSNPICAFVEQESKAGFGGQGVFVEHIDVIEKTVESIISDAKNAAGAAAEKATEEATTLITTEKIGVIDSISSSCQTAIFASVVAILIIALVMIIIYLVLRYRRKKKMNKKAHYTKLLNQ